MTQDFPNWIYHTSPIEITEINCFGTYRTGLCFSDKIYLMTQCQDFKIYRIDSNKLKILDISEVAYSEDLIYKALDYLEKFYDDLRLESAEELLEAISEKHDISKYDFDSDDHNLLQKLGLDIAIILGYDGCELYDEQGAMYLIDMKNRLCDLELVQSNQIEKL